VLPFLKFELMTLVKMAHWFAHVTSYVLGNPR